MNLLQSGKRKEHRAIVNEVDCMMDNETMNGVVAVAVASQQEHEAVTAGRETMEREPGAATLTNATLGNETAAVGVQTNKLAQNTGVPRDKNGRLLPGAKVPGSGRKSKAYEQSIVEALKESLPPEKLQYWVDKALEIAIAQQSTRGIVAVLQFAMEYGIGKPRQAINVTTSKADEIMDMIQHDDTPLLPE